MRIKKLFNTKSEYLDYAWSIITFDESKIWRDEDLPKLQPFFAESNGESSAKDYSKEQVRDSFAYYRKCLDEYATERVEIRDATRGWRNDGSLYEFFFLDAPLLDAYGEDEDGNEVDEEGKIITPTTRESLKLSDEHGIKFPMVFIGWIDTGYFRGSSDKIMFSEFVNREEFA